MSPWVFLNVLYILLYNKLIIEQIKIHKKKTLKLLLQVYNWLI